MLYYPIKNYEDYKSMFYRQTNDGRTIRQNKILLAFWRCKDVRDYIGKEIYKVTTIEQIREIVERTYKDQIRTNTDLRYDGYELRTDCDSIPTFYSMNLQTDQMHGICEDNTSISGFFRYYNHKEQQTFKRRIGAIVKACFEEAGMNNIMPEQLLRWYEQIITEEWKAYVLEKFTFSLRVDRDFDRIYNSDYYIEGEFDSCMTDKGYTSFYSNCFNRDEIFAASIVNKDDEIAARAVLFKAYRCSDDKPFWLCERQYGICEEYKKVLVNMLIAEGRIDGYKRIGAGCSDDHAFVDLDNNSLGYDFYVKVNIPTDSDVCYMDTFKWYDPIEHKAYNYDIERHYIPLSLWQNNLDDYVHYDEWYREDTFDEIEEAYSGGCRYDVALDKLLNSGDWEKINGTFYHNDDVEACPICGDLTCGEEGYWSDLTQETYCCNTCRKKGEEQYAKENGYVWVDMNDSWELKENCVQLRSGGWALKGDVIGIRIWDEEVGGFVIEYLTMSELRDELDVKNVVKFGGNYYHLFTKNYKFIFEVMDEMAKEMAKMETMIETV